MIVDTKIGIVQEVDYEKSTVKATFEGVEDSVIEDILVMHKNTNKDKTYQMPSIDERIICLFLEETVICLGSVYSEINLAPRDKDVFLIQFEDGTYFEYDKKEKKVIIDVKGDIQAKCESFSAEAKTEITVKAPKITLDGEVSVTKSLTADIDVKAKQTSLLSHTHSVIALGSPTGIPIGGV